MRACYLICCSGLDFVRVLPSQRNQSNGEHLSGQLHVQRGVRWSDWCGGWRVCRMRAWLLFWAWADGVLCVCRRSHVNAGEH